MGPKSIEWRSVDGGTWHLFIGSKSMCSRAYSNGKYECLEEVPSEKVDGKVCGHCKKAIPIICKRLIKVSGYE